MSESHRQRGDEAEELACNFLIDKGWHILERNYYSGHSEIDIIAKDGDVIVFIEVKMRSSSHFGNPVEFINEEKVEHVFKAAEAYVQEQKLTGQALRFDVIGILKPKNKSVQINYIPDAYR